MSKPSSLQFLESSAHPLSRLRVCLSASAKVPFKVIDNFTVNVPRWCEALVDLLHNVITLDLIAGHGHELGDVVDLALKDPLQQLQERLVGVCLGDVAARRID